MLDYGVWHRGCDTKSACQKSVTGLEGCLHDVAFMLFAYCVCAVYLPMMSVYETAMRPAVSVLAQR